MHSKPNEEERQKFAASPTTDPPLLAEGAVSSTHGTAGENPKPTLDMLSVTAAARPSRLPFQPGFAQLAAATMMLLLLLLLSALIL